MWLFLGVTASQGFQSLRLRFCMDFVSTIDYCMIHTCMMYIWNYLCNFYDERCSIMFPWLLLFEPLKISGQNFQTPWWMGCEIIFFGRKHFQENFICTQEMFAFGKLNVDILNLKHVLRSDLLREGIYGFSKLWDFALRHNHVFRRGQKVKYIFHKILSRSIKKTWILVLWLCS